MTYWILPAHPKKYQHLSSFEKFGYIDWVQTNNFEIGDIVYIYSARPISRIVCKSIVEKVNLTTNEKTDDSEFWLDSTSKNKSLSHNRFCRLRQLCINETSNITIDYLRELNITSFQSAQKISKTIATLFNEALKSGNDLYDESETLPEGARIQTYANRYERNPQARIQCISHYGSYACQICGFDFEKIYGAIGREFIHIHHKVPISEIGVEYQVNPIRDLIPVCPNCHAMLHRNIGNQRITTEELKNKIK